MKLDRAQVVKHLQRIGCGGQITEAVFSGAFGTSALTPDQHLLVIAPPLPKGKTLFKEPAGMPDLSLLMKALAVLSGEGNEAIKVDLQFENHRLVIDEEHRGILRLMTAKPKTIGTYVEEDIVTKLLAKAPTAKQLGIPLTRNLVEGIRNTFSMLKVTEVELFIGPKGGKIRVGGEHSHVAEFESDELKATKEYSLLFGDHIVDALGVVTNYDEAVLCLGGPKGFAMIEDGGYRYLIGSQTRSKDE